MTENVSECYSKLFHCDVAWDLFLKEISRTRCGLSDLWGIMGCADLLLIDLLKDVFEATVIFLEDGVLGAEVERPGLGQPHLEGAVSEVADGLVRVVHAQSHASCACSRSYNSVLYF